MREAQIIAQVDHPSIVPIHDIGVDAAGWPYFTMELVDSHTLYDAGLRQRVRRPPRR